VPIKDPTAWMHDLEFYMGDENVVDNAEAIEPTLLYGGSKMAAGAWLIVLGLMGGAFGGVTLSPAIRTPRTFIVYVIVAAVLLRGLYPLTVTLLGRAMGWVGMFGFFWVVLLGMFTVFAARMESRWAAYGTIAGLGFFVGMMYGAFPPGASRREDAWMGLALPSSMLGSGVAVYLLRHLEGAIDTAPGAAIAGASAGGILMLPMGWLLTRLWNQGDGLTQMGLLYLHNDNFATKAVAYLDRAIALRPNDARAYTLRGVAWSRLGEAERAAADWTRAQTLAPHDPDPLVQYGVDALRRGANADAISSFERALEKDPKRADVHRHLSTAFATQGDRLRALEHADRAVTLGRDNARAHVHRARLRAERGEYELAREDAERAIKLESSLLDSRLPVAYVVYGEVLTALGEQERAAQSFEQALDLDIEPAVRERALAGLAALGKEYVVGSRDGEWEDDESDDDD